MYSATPPEKVTWSMLVEPVRGSSRRRPPPLTQGLPPMAASKSLSASRAARWLPPSGESRRPTSRSSPSSVPTRRPASSSRTTCPCPSTQTRRAPPSTAVRSLTRPSQQIAIFEVPPPTSIFITVALSRIERATAPDPCAAITVSGLEPAAGRDGHHLAGLPGKQFANLAGIAPAHRDPSQDQRSGVDLVRIYIGVLVLARDEGTQRLSINVLGRRIGCEQNIGLIERFSG